jgi:hypothetical protein
MTGGSAGAGSGGGAGGSVNNGPAITSAPPAWVRPAECHGIGNRCPNLSGCEEGSTCQTVGDVCIPAFEPGATSLPGKSMERPYCAAFTCMTFVEASCFCTGEAGKTTDLCSSPGALAGLCKGKSIRCDADSPCCDGLSCVSHGSYSTCETSCAADSDCDTGCCTDLYDTGTSICATMMACTNPCNKQGEACTPGSSTTRNSCCRGSCVQSENPDFAGCRSDCTKDSDCPDTGCCQLFKDSSNGFCAPARYCQCQPVGGACGISDRCCEGGICAGTSATDLSCLQACTSASDCATNCCAALSDNSASVCEPPEYCP